MTSSNVSGSDLGVESRARRGARPFALRTLLALTVVALVAGACATESSAPGGGAAGETTTTTEGEPVSGGTLVFGLAGETDGYNPVVNRWADSGLTVANAIYDPMTVIDPDGVARPYLVEAIEPSADFEQWTITPREGIRFHNGDPLTPQVLTDHLNAMKAGMLSSLSLGPMERAELADGKVLVTMTEPWSTFPSFLASFQVGYVPHPDVLDGTSPDPIGTGPYVFEEWVPNDHLDVRRNDDYWREGLPYLDAIEFRIITDDVSRYNALQAGDIDMMVTIAPDQISTLLDDAQAQEQFQFVEPVGDSAEANVILNTQSGPTADVEVRRALQLATDRQAIVDFYGGRFPIADAPVSPDSPFYTDPDWPDRDVDAASKLVQEWEDDNGPLTIELSLVGSPNNLSLGQVLAQQWAEAGIDARIESIDQARSTVALPAGEFEAYLMYFWKGTDPDENYAFWDPNRVGEPGQASINFARYTSDATKDGLVAARATADVQARADLYAGVWADWAEHVPYLWLFHNGTQFVADRRVHGLGPFTLPNGDPAATLVDETAFFTAIWLDE
jgi:peptide/nickel transport system substrate-binding protein